MSIVFVPQKLRGNAKINQETIQRLLDENDQFIRCIVEYMQKGRAVECVKYQQFLHRNIVYLATLADASPDDEAPSTSLTTSWPIVTLATKDVCVPAGTTNPEVVTGTLPHQSY
ncbi:SS18-like protein 2 [Stigmatopora argus]